MSRVASIRPHRLLPLVRLHACMSTEATSLAEKVLLAAKVQAGSILNPRCRTLFPSVICLNARLN